MFKRLMNLFFPVIALQHLATKATVSTTPLDGNDMHHRAHINGGRILNQRQYRKRNRQNPNSKFNR